MSNSGIRKARALMKLLSLAVVLVIFAELGLLRSNDRVNLRVKHDIVSLTSQLPSKAYWTLNTSWILTSWHTTGASLTSSLLSPSPPESPVNITSDDDISRLFAGFARPKTPDDPGGLVDKGPKGTTPGNSSSPIRKWMSRPSNGVDGKSEQQLSDDNYNSRAFRSLEDFKVFESSILRENIEWNTSLALNVKDRKVPPGIGHMKDNVTADVHALTGQKQQQQQQQQQIELNSQQQKTNQLPQLQQQQTESKLKQPLLKQQSKQTEAPHQTQKPKPLQSNQQQLQAFQKQPQNDQQPQLKSQQVQPQQKAAPQKEQNKPQSQKVQNLYLQPNTNSNQSQPMQQPPKSRQLLDSKQKQNQQKPPIELSKTEQQRQQNQHQEHKQPQQEQPQQQKQEQQKQEQQQQQQTLQQSQKQKEAPQKPEENYPQETKVQQHQQQQKLLIKQQPKESQLHQPKQQQKQLPPRNQEQRIQVKQTTQTSKATSNSQKYKQNKSQTAKNGTGKTNKQPKTIASKIPRKPDCIPGTPTTGALSARKRFLQWQAGEELDKVSNAIGPDLVLDKRKYFIYRCDAGVMDGCCGWADRVRGILGGYLMANLTGRVFKIEILDQGCDLTSFYTPNKVNWTLPHSFHSTITNNTKDTQIIDVVNDHSFYQKLSTLDLSQVINASARYVYFKGNLNFLVHFRDSKIYNSQLSWMQRVGWHRIHAVLFRRLFKMAPAFKSRLDAFLSSAHDGAPERPLPLVCAHVRVGDSIAFFKNFHNRIEFPSLDNVWRFITNKSLELHNQQNLISSPNITGSHAIKDNLDLKSLWKETKVFVTSDSSKVLDIARNQSFSSALMTVPGDILHVDKNEAFSREAKCSGLGKLLLEQAVLMNCDVLLISHSGVSTQAASVRSSHSQLYIFTEDYDVKPYKLYC